jgi:glycosyltransferase involved in cell wall biosynthesis
MNHFDTYIHITPSVSRLAGGLFESVRHLSQSIGAAARHQVAVIGLNDERATADQHRWAPLPLRILPVLGPRNLGFAPGLHRQLLDSGPRLVHLHGLWKLTCLAVSRWSRLTRRPFIASPHGMLEPWALRRSAWKKRCALWLYTGPCLRRAACLRATSQLEASSIRRAGFTNPIALIPNGVHCPTHLPPRQQDAKQHRALFLSRIHPKKGLLNLIHAWAAIRPADWRLSIAGPDEAGHLTEVKSLVHGLRLENVQFLGEAWDDAKTSLLLQTDLFVLPSYSENFGLVIPEALACAVPVITTRATPWQELLQHHCGWWIDLGVPPLIDALKAAFATPIPVLRAMGSRGRALVQARYSWEPIGQRMLQVYQWMLDRRTKPDYVLLDSSASALHKGHTP